MATLAGTSLGADERALLEHFVSELRSRLGKELHHAWLFGSRARGDLAVREHSDVDVLVIAADASWEGKRRVRGALEDSARALGLETLAWSFSIHVNTPEWLAERRALRSFFITEVDRDKIVLSGSE